jgi:hypothetical protein
MSPATGVSTSPHISFTTPLGSDTFDNPDN